MDKINGWLNIYKPKAISSAKVVSIIKRALKGNKIGHCGTLDVEAEGVLPLAIGEATKLVNFLVEARKIYMFTIKFGARTDTADSTGKIIEETSNIPSEQQCQEICSKFIGIINQVPPAFSAIKINGIRSYKLARQGSASIIASRNISIYRLEMLNFDQAAGSATYLAECSKGTYIRTLGEDIALSLQSLGFVLELRRTQVGNFKAENALTLEDLRELDQEGIYRILETSSMKIEAVLDDILVLEATAEQAKKIRYGQKCFFDYEQSASVWIRYNGTLLAIGSLSNNCFISSRVFNLI